MTDVDPSETAETVEMDERPDPRPAHGGPFVPVGFTPPAPPSTDEFWLEPLGPQHNDADFAAWTSSMEHIQATVGFVGWGWPHPMTLDDNMADLEMHARHFAAGLGFTYTVRAVGDGDVIGCVYIYPSDDASLDAQVRSWVRVTHADLDPVVASLIAEWLAGDWPFTTIRYR